MVRIVLFTTEDSILSCSRFLSFDGNRQKGRSSAISVNCFPEFGCLELGLSEKILIFDPKEFPMKTLFSTSPILMPQSLALLRILLGLFLIYHGKEVFQADLMEQYTTWDDFKSPQSQWLPYLGKSAEFVAGILLLIGLLTRVGGVICAATFLYITFYVGQGKFWYEDQHPFLFALLGLFFVFAGPGVWSVEKKSLNSDSLI
jgi:putative oxidoreductase